MGDVRLRPVTRDDVPYLVGKQTPEVTAPYNWFGYRSEAEILGHGERLGSVGTRIVTETLIGLLDADPNSYRSAYPQWQCARRPAR